MSSDVATMISNGRTAEEKFDRESAIEQYRHAVQANPDNREACFRLAYVLDLVGEGDEALSLLEQSCRDGDTPLNALVNLAILYEDEGEYARAERCLKLVLDTDPNADRARIFMKDVHASRTMYVEDEVRTREFQVGVFNTPISDFELSARARNCLKKMNIRSLGDLLKISEAELMAYKNFGETTLTEIKGMLAQKNLRLGQTIDEQHSVAREEIYHQLAESAGGEAVNVLSQNVEELELSVRARKALSLLGIESIGDLVARTEAELLGIKNFGATSLDEIKERLTERGLSLRHLDS